jgi:hypothetical protein
MKKVITILFGAVLVGALASGCATKHVSQYSSPLEVELKTAVTPEVTVGGAIEGTATLQRVLFFTFGATEFADGVNYGLTTSETGLFGGLFGGMFEAGKAAAAYKACTANQADVILAPRYTIDDNDYFVYQKTTYTVKGYKGTLTGIKK